MSTLIALSVLAIGLAVAYVVSGPLRKAAGEPTSDASEQREQREHEIRQDDLMAAREAKYREIRDAELDYRTGKLSEEDYKKLDAQLRAEAIKILNSLEEQGRT